MAQQQPEIQEVQLQSYGKVSKFDPEQLELQDPDLGRRLANVDRAFGQMSEAGRQFYQQEQENLKELVGFSNSLLNFAIERQQEENERAQARGALAFSRDKMAREAAAAQYDAQSAELDERGAVTREAAMTAQKADAPFEVVEGLSKLSGFERKGYAIAMAKSAGQSWTAFAMQQLKENDEEITLPDGSVIAVNALQKDPAQHAAVLGHLKEKWMISSGMSQLSNGILAKHALPGIDSADESLMKAARRQYAVNQSFHDIQEATNAFDESDPSTFHHLIHTLARSVDVNGTPIGYAGAWKKLETILVERESAGHEIDVDFIRGMQVPGEKEGVTYGTKFKSKLEGLERRLREERHRLVTYQNNEDLTYAYNTEQQILSQLTADSSMEDIQNAQRAYMAAHPTGARSDRIDAFYANRTVEGKELQNRMEHYQRMQEMGLLDPETIAREPVAVQEKFMKAATDQQEVREATGNFKDIDKEVEGLVKAKAKDLTLPGEHYGTGTFLVIGELKSRIRMETQRLLAGDPNMSASAAAMAASNRVMSEFREAQNIDGHRYQLGINGFDNFFSTSIDRDKAATSANQTRTMLTQIKNNVNVIDEEGFLGDATFFQNLEKDMKTPGFAMPTRLTYLSQKTGIHVLELIDRGRRANGLPSLPGYNQALDTIKQADPEFQRFTNGLIARSETRNRAQRMLRVGNIPVRESMVNLMPPPPVEAPPQVSLVPGDKARALNLIAKFESASSGGYDAVNQYGEEGGTKTGADKGFYSGPFSLMKQHGGRKLTDLSVAEVLELQYDDRSMTNEEWRDAGKLHAVGRYQIVGNTLPGLVERAGIDPSAKFNSETQDKLALQLLRERGWKPWIGAAKLSPQEKLFLETFMR